MKSDQKKWNTRYKENKGDLTPSDLVRQYCSLAASGKALDLACGNGRNSLFLAENNFDVEAVDISTVALSYLDGLHSGITPVCADLDTYRIIENRYEIILSIKFLDRALFAAMERGLKPGGVLIFESFVGEKNQPYCLVENELASSFPGLRTEFYQERLNPDPSKFKKTARLVAVKPN